MNWAPREIRPETEQEAAVSTIESYGEIATGKPSVDDSHRVTIQAAARQGSRILEDRSVTRCKAIPRFEQGESRQTIEDFRQALTDAYGQAIATAVQCLVAGQTHPGDNLSTRGIQEALRLADRCWLPAKWRSTRR